MTAVDGSCIETDWRSVAVECELVIANLAVRHWPEWHDNNALNVLLDRAGERLCAYMLSHGVPRATIDAALDQMAATCKSRLLVLDRAALGPGGHA